MEENGKKKRKVRGNGREHRSREEKRMLQWRGGEKEKGKESEATRRGEETDSRRGVPARPPRGCRKRSGETRVGFSLVINNNGAPPGRETPTPIPNKKRHENGVNINSSETRRGRRDDGRGPGGR